MILPIKPSDVTKGIPILIPSRIPASIVKVFNSLIFLVIIRTGIKVNSLSFL